MLFIASLIFLGILLILIELLLIPGVGVAGILGLAALIAAPYYAFVHLSTKAGIIVTLIILVLITLSIIYILRFKTWKKFETHTVIDSKINDDSESLEAGMTGTALTRIAPMGTARFGEINCEVKSDDNSMIDAGTDLEVVRVKDNKVYVKPINN